MEAHGSVDNAGMKVVLVCSVKPSPEISAPVAGLECVHGRCRIHGTELRDRGSQFASIFRDRAAQSCTFQSHLRRLLSEQHPIVK